ncbi:hypothetical protein GE09DRAFT_392347 [Coniochaeta sp. 2T2.1]|nr:hypothetical protein GE09DRAFT_392347 [Coniochaeta sp. 2T2.1]
MSRDDLCQTPHSSLQSLHQYSSTPQRPTMKLTLSVLPLLTTLLSLSHATPLTPETDSSPAVNATSELKPRDKWCRLHDDVTPPGHCRTHASTTYRSIKDIKRSDRFGVECRMFGDYANNNNVWDWVPGWGCYVSASITDPDCESEYFALTWGRWRKGRRGKEARGRERGEKDGRARR